jgi:hypothetical protein
MDLVKIIGELRDEREKLNQIIQSLEHLNKSSVKFTGQTESRRGRRFMDADARMDVSKRMKKYWAARRAENGKSD